VCIAIVPSPGAAGDAEVLRAWGKQRLVPAKVPRRYAFVAELPRNTLGKTLKPEVKKLF
jgi:acyl-coenzyme A synthetase/AMP-(fatty) acid ligase